MSLVYSGAEPQPSLAWTFDGTTTDYVRGSTGTTSGTITYNSGGKYGSSIVIINPTLTANYVNYTDTILALSGATGFAISMWVKVNGSLNNSLQYILNMTGPGNAREALLIQINSTSNRLGFQCFNNEGTNISCLTATTPTIGRWYHTVSVVTGSNLMFYLDGVLAAGPVVCDTSSRVYGYSSTYNSTFRLGGGINTGSGRALRDGEVDDLRIYNTALTSTQVQSVYSSQGAPAPSRAMPLPKLAWDFNGTTAPYIGTVSSTTVTGAVAYGSGKYGQDVIIRNPINGGFANVITYNLSTSIPVDAGVTFTLWVKYLALPASTFGTTTFVISGTNVAIYLGARGPNIWIIGGFLNGSFYDSASVNQTLTTDTWYHMGLTVGFGQISMYFNGVLRKTSAYTLPVANSLTIARVGADNGYAGDNVELDDLRIFDRALTSAQVQAIYNQNGMPGRGVQNSRVPTFTVSDQSQSPINFQTYRTDGPIPTSSSSPFGGTEGSFAPTILTFNSIFPSTISKLNFDFFSPTSKSFMECWVYVPSVTNYPRIWFRQTGLSGNPSWGDFIFFLNPSPGKVGLILSTGASTINSFLSSVNYITNSWNHISMSWDNTNTTAYISVNGSVSSQSQSGRTSEYTSSSSIQFGVFFDAGSLMSNFRLVQNATTLPYITNGFTVPTAPLSVYPTGTTALLLRSVSPLTMFSGGAIQSATGGNTVQDIGGYRIHTFTTIGTSTFTPSTSGNVEVLVVAGGGSGGVRHAGGGGAGGLIYNSSFPVSGAVSVTVGDGGAGLPRGTNAAVPGNAGSNSVFGSLASIGGGGGGGNGGAGGSGGGGGATGTGGAGTPGQGNNGAFGSTGPFTGQNAYGGGGGGGAGAAGTNSTSVAPVQAGAGGIGLQYSISGTPVYYAGGGGGGTTIADGGGAGGAGGLGGGGAGGGSNSIVGIAGTNGTGGGGGCGGFANVGGNYASGKGGSGIVIVRYPLPVRMSGTPLFTQLSQAATSSAVGAFSLRAVNGTSARAVQIRRSSDSATQDFYADRLGNLLTDPVSGQTLQKWLGGAGANVVTWYDQSGLGNNATGSGSFIYQTSNVNMQWAVKSGSLLTVTSPSTFITNTNFTIHSVTRRTTSSQAPGGGGTAPTNQAIYALSGSGTASYNRIITLYDYQGNRFSFNSLNPTQYTVIGNTGCGLYSTSGPVDYLAVIWNGTTTQMYYNGSTSASTAAATFGNIPIASNFTLLGANAYGSIVGGEFGEIIVFNSSLSASDISKLYSAR